MKSLQELTRHNIWSLAPYSSARNEYAGREARVFLDANENPYNQPFNRYPDPLQLELKAALSKVKGVPAENIFLGNGSDEAIDLSNAYAPEHLIIQTKDYNKLANKVVNAGSVFLGEYACESAGDYASGTNHTLPTHGYATAYSGVNLDSYCRKVTFQHLSEEGIHSIGRAVELMAGAEQLDAHKNAMTVRLRAINN